MFLLYIASGDYSASASEATIQMASALVAPNILDSIFERFEFDRKFNHSSGLVRLAFAKR